MVVHIVFAATSDYAPFALTTSLSVVDKVKSEKCHIHFMYADIVRKIHHITREDTLDMISVDMGCVGADLGCTERMVSICAKDSGGPYNYDLTSDLVAIAKEKKLDYAIDVYPHYGSDVESTVSAGYDIRHALIGAGVYASHNYERSHVDGVKNTYKLLKAYLNV